jgi:hypothetical protein
MLPLFTWVPLANVLVVNMVTVVTIVTLVTKITIFSEVALVTLFTIVTYQGYQYSDGCCGYICDRCYFGYQAYNFSCSYSWYEKAPKFSQSSVIL